MEADTAIECTYAYVLLVQGQNVYRGLVVLGGQRVWANSREVNLFYCYVCVFLLCRTESGGGVWASLR